MGWAKPKKFGLGRYRHNTSFSFLFGAGPDPNGPAQARMGVGLTQQPFKLIMLHAKREFVVHAAT